MGKNILSSNALKALAGPACSGNRCGSTGEKCNQVNQATISNYNLDCYWCKQITHRSMLQNMLDTLPRYGEAVALLAI